MTDDKKITFKDLSGWLKFAFIWTLVNAVATILMLFIYAIVGMALLI